MKMIVISVQDEPSVSRSVLEAGADGFVLEKGNGDGHASRR